MKGCVSALGLVETILPMVARPHERYRVTLRVDEGDILRKVTVLHAALYRIVSATKLIRVERSEYEQGELDFVIETEEDMDPMVVPGEVTARFESISD